MSENVLHSLLNLESYQMYNFWSQIIFPWVFEDIASIVFCFLSYSYGYSQEVYCRSVSQSFVYKQLFLCGSL